jgi:amyloid beta precursor protein binding protein 1
MIAVKSYGLIGSLRLQLRQHSIVESRLENDSFDLRIAVPFEELHAYCASFDLETSRMDTFAHSHIPYVVILYKAIDMWRSQVS